MVRAKEKTIDMTEGPIFGKLLAFAFPLMLSGILQSLYNAADNLVVGRFASEAALAAVGACGSICSLLVAVFISISVGTSVTVAHAVGAKDKERTERLVHTSVTLSLVLGVFVTVVGLLTARPLLLMMNTPEEILDMATDYLRIYCAGALFSIFYNFGAAILRSAGDSKRPLYYLAISGAVNVLLNLLFVIGFGMTADGVALATALSQALSAVFVLFALLRRTDDCRLSLHALRICRRELIDVLRIGVPAAIQGALFSISNMMVQSTVNTFDTPAVAGNTAARQLDDFIWMATSSVGVSSVTAIGQNMGARKLSRIPRAVFSCLLVGTLTSALMGAVVYFSAPTLLYLFLPNGGEAMTYALTRIAILSTTYFTAAWMDTLSSVMRGLGYSFLPMVVSVFGVCGIRMLWITLIFPLIPTYETAFYCFPVSWILTAIAHFICFLIVFRQIKRREAGKDAAIAANA